jgi:tRNA G37 N-methylase Trm5
MASSFAHLCTRLEAVEEYERLKKTGLLNLNLKPMPYGNMIAIPTTEGELELDFQIIEKHNPHNLLNQILINPPKKWEKLGDLVIFQQGTDTSDWPLSKVANALGANKLAIQAEIDPGIKRQSNMKLILGNDGWVIHKENFIEYEFDATAVMFSSGNVTERRRMGQINTANETIVDAYCGVGYYTLPFLVNGGAKHVHACEINPDSISALQKGLARNNVSEKCTIHQGDNRKTMNDLRGIADRVILGLIPSSMNTWGLAINCLKPSGGIIHVHMNVHENEIEEWVEKTTDWFTTVSGKTATATHLEKVKWYCPHIRHVVLDIELS